MTPGDPLQMIISPRLHQMIPFFMLDDIRPSGSGDNNEHLLGMAEQQGGGSECPHPLPLWVNETPSQRSEHTEGTSNALTSRERGEVLVAVMNATLQELKHDLNMRAQLDATSQRDGDFLSTVADVILC